MRWLLDVERAYMTRVGDISSGEFDFEPLMGENAGDAIYLTRLAPEALEGYRSDLDRLSKQLPAMAGMCRRPEELNSISRCAANVLRDVAQIQRRKPR